MIINEVGTHADVKALVFVAAFEPDVGESVADLSDKMPAAAKSVGPVGDGFLAVDPDAFAADFAADAPKPVARLMAISQVPVAGEAFGAKATVAAWKQKPSCAVISKQDRMINSDLERFMAKRAQSQVIELPGSHANLSFARAGRSSIDRKTGYGSEVGTVSQFLLLCRFSAAGNDDVTTLRRAAAEKRQGHEIASKDSGSAEPQEFQF
jgi:hypothetical protein